MIICFALTAARKPAPKSKKPEALDPSLLPRSFASSSMSESEAYKQALRESYRGKLLRSETIRVPMGAIEATPIAARQRIRLNERFVQKMVRLWLMIGRSPVGQAPACMIKPLDPSDKSEVRSNRFVTASAQRYYYVTRRAQ